jgi:magnesium-transporting ATPase (P-type)
MYGYNEFSVEAPEPAYVKFAKSIYEQPLILLLLASAVVSAVMHNIDDAVSITIAILIVLTGIYLSVYLILFEFDVVQLDSCRNADRRSHWKRLIS